MLEVRYRFFVVGSSHHHLYYLMPYIEAVEDRECCLINSPSKYRELVIKEYPHVNFKYFRAEDESLIQYLNQGDFLVYANAYDLFNREIKGKISESVVLVYIVHGVMGKFVDKGYVMSNFLWDVTVFSGRKDLDLVYSVLDFPEDERLYGRSLFWNMGDGRKVQIILSGNLRVQNYFKSRCASEKLFQDIPILTPERKTVLYMPTYSYDISRVDSSYSSIPFFIRMLKEGVVPDSFNYIVKLHPNMIWERELLEELISALRGSCLRFYLDVFGRDYLPYMDLCDLMITDRSSAFYDFLYFDKPVVFLDHNGECPEEISFEDVTNSYWSYQCGPVVSEREMPRLSEIIEGAIENDVYREIRKKVKEYAFFDGVTPRDVLLEMLKHPKFSGKLS